MLKSSFSPHCMQRKDGCQGVAEGVAKVSIPRTRLSQGIRRGASQVARKSWIEAQKAYCENQPGAITPTWTGRKKPVPATGSEGFRLGPLEGFILDS